MLRYEECDDVIHIETACLKAEVHTTDYVSGIMGGTFTDKKTGATDPTFALHMMDFLMAPGWREDDGYVRDPAIHGDLPKHIVEGPQIATKVPRLPYEILETPDCIAVRLHYTFTEAPPPYRAGSRWEQLLVFLPDTRFVFTCETVDCVNALDNLFYRIDMPGHIRHNRADTFSRVHLSYRGTIEAEEFLEDFPPDGRFFYRRDPESIPERFIRAYQLRMPDGTDGPWLAGMTLDPCIPCEAWCHQRGYVCFIQENHGLPVHEGQTVGAAYIIGYFDSLDRMRQTYDRYKDVHTVSVDEAGYRLHPH